jgi:ATP-binding cassette, subfamily F, member 3
MIAAVNIVLQYGERSLFKDASFHIGPHDRIGLVGSNGAGKSTLFKVLLGEVIPDQGQIAKAKYVSVGYLPQEAVTATGKTLFEEVASVFSDILDMQARIEQIQRDMAHLDQESDEFHESLELYGELQHRLELSDSFRMKAEIEKVLMGLGFAERDFSRETGEFSGGWQMRIALARLLLQQPSLLLLDEPTNHLDLDSLQWLEEYLAAYQGAVMIISHDRRFLDNMTRRTFELSKGTLSEYAGNWSAAMEERTMRLEQQRAALRNQQLQIKHTEQFIERFRYKATKARQVQSRIKQLEKIERIEIEDDEGMIHFSFPDAPSSGRVVMDLKGIRKRYGAVSVFEEIDFDIERGDRIAFVGPNGAGKSTLARIIAGVEPFDAGTRTVGHNVAISYFAQDQADALRPEYDVLQTVDEVATGEIRKRLRTLLGCFLFSGDDVYKMVRVLSGGEKSRLALARMLLQPSNLIIMDEPTNHLDVRSKTVLLEALDEYEGSVVIVSHDRDFLDPLVTKVIEFRQGGIKTTLGNVSDYLAARRHEEEETASAGATRLEGPVLSEKERKRLEAEARQERYEKTKPLRDKIVSVERSIEIHERWKREAENLMADPEFYKNGERVKNVSAEYKEIEKKLNEEYHIWNDVTKELDRIQTEFDGRVRR